MKCKSFVKIIILFCGWATFEAVSRCQPFPPPLRSVARDPSPMRVMNQTTKLTVEEEANSALGILPPPLWATFGLNLKCPRSK